MKNDRSFLLVPSIWLGEGKIELNLVNEVFTFFTRWKIGEKDSEGRIEAIQEIEIKGLSDIMRNEFVFSRITDKDFVVEIENEAIGTVKGKGILTPDSISWEFKDPAQELEGFEFYQREEDNKYRFRADYATTNRFRTEICGKIWEKGSSKSV